MESSLTIRVSGKGYVTQNPLMARCMHGNLFFNIEHSVFPIKRFAATIQICTFTNVLRALTRVHSAEDGNLLSSRELMKLKRASVSIPSNLSAVLGKQQSSDVECEQLQRPVGAAEGKIEQKSGMESAGYDHKTA